MTTAERAAQEILTRWDEIDNTEDMALIIQRHYDEELRELYVSVENTKSTCRAILYELNQARDVLRVFVESYEACGEVELAYQRAKEIGL